ncbi:uncharacterized protein TRAVEDRAFT_129214 [Trametes versicolor FP-101664 SS1]|uniref:uncharacterized protein n=1 Tax=Trametes versicolor (strain FP-101664) TaxID=717944 RepID=UPI0004622F67|nr:uncharacterized protein TRAVEDRAFT_129214 [Trametes versicolor FP-101664 SS1]EIW56144.1 hypothetical protein TRAVEDRAFT_129214 [Trametes versicolor FP-101664 SS1]
MLSFIRLGKLVKPNIEIYQRDRTRPAVQLPTHIQEFLAASLRKSLTEISWYWYAFMDAIWSEGEVQATEEEVAIFHAHGLSRTIVEKDIMTLTEPITYRATLFTLREGALPIFTTSLYCHVCHRRYHHNYTVDKANSLRTYYGGPPPTVIQVATHFFVEAAVLELFGNGMVFGWLSAGNCARIYNASLARCDASVQNNIQAYGRTTRSHLSEIGWPYALDMNSDIAMNGFLLYSLLLDKAEHGSHLELPHDFPTQKDRLATALAERNNAMEGIGQEEWTHACDLCFIVKEASDGSFVKIQYAVGDGLSMGRPCCAVHDCKINLATKRDIYCPIHAPLFAHLCAVLSCGKPAAVGFQTCGLSEHRALEDAYRKDGSRAIHQLRARLLDLHTAGQDGDADDEVLIIKQRLGNDDTSPACDSKAEGTTTTLKARFGRRRTHNEQLVERPCGVILSRATFFGSEAVSAVKDHLKAVFPTARSKPEIFIYDNNCKLRQHLNASGDTYFSETGLPVDVFHFKTKHRVTDTECQQFCNPAAFPDLVDGDKWRVNSSICEETNAWFGGYLSIVREMEATRYTFFLDEMIKRRNRFTVTQLERRGHHPWRIPIEVLFSGCSTR